MKPRTLYERYPDIADDPDEVLFADVRKHWIGLLAIYLIGVLMIILAVLLASLTPWFAHAGGVALTAEALSLVWLGAIVLTALVLIGTLIAAWVYQASHLLITNENVIEVRQISLFSRKVSHLNMINVEDVTVSKNGIFQTLLNYGRLLIQTAGERENFNFTYTPDPNTYRRYIIQAHEAAITRAGQAGVAQRIEVARGNL